MFPYKICKGWRDEQLASSCALMATCGEYFPFSSMQSGKWQWLFHCSQPHYRHSSFKSHLMEPDCGLVYLLSDHPSQSLLISFNVFSWQDVLWFTRRTGLWIVCYAITCIHLKLLSLVSWNCVSSVILHIICSDHPLDRWSIPGSHMRKRYLMGLLLKQKVLQRKGHKAAIPGNVSWNISSSKGKTVILILLTHSEDCS